MNNKSIIIYTVIFLILVVIAYLMVIQRGEKTASYKVDEKLFVVDSASVDRIEFEKNKEKFVIVKSGLEWRILEPINYKVESKFIPLLLSDLANYKIESLVSDNPAAKDNFGFHDTNYVTVTVFESGELKGIIDIGNAGAGASQTFVRVAGEDKIFLASSFLRNNFDRSEMNEWRDKFIFSIPKPDVVSVEFVFPDGSYTFTWDTLGHYFVDGLPADTAAVDGFLNIMQNFNTQTFFDEEIEIDGSFNYIIKINTKDGMRELMLKRLSDDEDSDYLLKVSGIDQVFKFNQALAGNLIKRRSDYLKNRD